MKDLTNPESKRQSGLIEILGKPKILNVLKADLAKALKNAEIDGMITAFGLEIKDGKVRMSLVKDVTYVVKYTTNRKSMFSSEVMMNAYR